MKLAIIGITISGGWLCMSYKCRICNTNEVDTPDGVCDMCAVTMDPYAQAMNGGSGFSNEPGSDTGSDTGKSYRKSGKNRKVLLNTGDVSVQTDPYGNVITPSERQDQTVKVYQAGTVPTSQQVQAGQTNAGYAAAPVNKKNAPVTTGIIKNISVDTEERSMLVKILSAVFKGTPVCTDDTITMFQVFPDFSGTAVNAMGNACDQVIVYGKITTGVLAENNDVEVYGYRDSRNNVVAKTIKNTASGTTITPRGAVSAGAVRLIFLAILAVLAVICAVVGLEGIIIGIIIVICLTNLPVVFKIISAVFGGLFSVLRRIFR